MKITNENKREFIERELGKELTDYMFKTFGDVNVGMIYKENQTEESLEHECEPWYERRDGEKYSTRSYSVSDIPEGEYCCIIPNIRNEGNIPADNYLPCWIGGELKVQGDGYHEVIGLEVHQDVAYGLGPLHLIGNVNEPDGYNWMEDTIIVYWKPLPMRSFNGMDPASMSVIQKYLSKIWSEESNLFEL